MELATINLDDAPRISVTLDLSAFGKPAPEPEASEPPKLRERKIGKFLYVAVMAGDRVEPVSALSRKMVAHGFQVMLAPLHNIARERFGYLPPGIVVFRSASLTDLKIMFSAGQTGGHMIALSRGTYLIQDHQHAAKLVDQFLDDELSHPDNPEKLLTLWRRNQYPTPFEIKKAYQPADDDAKMPFTTVPDGVEEIGRSAWLMH